MIQQEKDFLMKMIHSFFEALEKLLHGMKAEEKITIDQLDHIGQQFLNLQISFFLKASFNEIKLFLKNEPDKIQKIHAIAECLYKFSQTEDRPAEKSIILKRYKELVKHRHKISGQISLEDYTRIATIE